MSNDVPRADSERSAAPPNAGTSSSDDTARSAAQQSAAGPDASLSAAGPLPSCPEPLPPQPAPADPSAALAPGQRIGDFEIVDVLGRGGFGVVYLARQLSLDRHVALKVTAAIGSEGRKMAQLEHEHIVQVFSEIVEPQSRRQLLCMQYVPGPTLQAVLAELQTQDPAAWSGAALLAVVDRLTRRAASFDPAAMRHRELLRGADWIQSVCWLGARLAEALDYAHAQGVVHRDIKPGNIMLSQYGRPLLLDFNLAFRPLEAVGGQGQDPFGGTLAYMAPEHLDAFDPDGPGDRRAVAEPADIYSLGVVLYQMLTGELPFGERYRGEMGEVLRAMAANRRAGPPPLAPHSPRELEAVLARCLHPDPSQRYGSGRELSAALEGCRQFHAARQAAPRGGRLLRLAQRHPFVWLLLLAFLPHLPATVINIAYNQIRIISHLTPQQQAVFVRLVFSYDLFAYTLGTLLGLRVILPVARIWDAACAGRGDAARINAERVRSQTWPAWAAALACLGWLPGGPVFVLVLGGFAGGLAWHVAAHLIISFTLCGLIALTYSMLFVQWAALCVFYPRLWCDVHDFRAAAARELRPVPRRLRTILVLSGLIPLLGAALMTGVGPLEFTPAESVSFRFLVTTLILLGLAGFQFALFATGRLAQALAALTGNSALLGP